MAVKSPPSSWLTELQQYHFKLLHKPGLTHTKPDFLLRLPGLDKGENDNKNITLLPEHHFHALHQRLHRAELFFGAFPEAIQKQLTYLHKDKYDRQALKGLDTHDKDWIDYGHGQITYKDRLYIPADSQLHTDIIREHHDTIATGHPGRWKTQENITRD